MALSKGVLCRSQKVELQSRIEDHNPASCLRKRTRKTCGRISWKPLSLPQKSRRSITCSALAPFQDMLTRTVGVSCGRAVDTMKMSQVVWAAPAVGILVFTGYSLTPLMQLIRRLFFKNERNWEKSRMYLIVMSYIRPLLFWMGAISLCRAVDPVVLSSATSQRVKERVVSFVSMLSTMLAFAVCATNLIKEVQASLQKLNPNNTPDLGLQFIGNAVSTSVWVAAACLFMELLGFSTQKLITAGGFGTVLVTLAGREIFTNFLSSIMIHATRPFTESEWIQTKIEGQEISGTVEHVGWWAPTVVRGDDREAVHIPNHKFTVSVVRNLSQKTHWRIKTHLGIRHSDAPKLNLIIADMRKVLSSHPKVEDKGLHRRVFFDSVDSKSQALLILVSCFVKSSRYEEYLRVKESILMDLLKVVAHHKAQLATPVRSVERLSTDESPEHNYSGRPMLLPATEQVEEESQPESKADNCSQLEKFDSVRTPAATESPKVEAPDCDAVQDKEQISTPKVEVLPSRQDFDADHLAHRSKPRKIFVQDHVEQQIVGRIIAAKDNIIIFDSGIEAS